MPELQKKLGEGVAADTRAVMDPKLQDLQQRIGMRLRRAVTPWGGAQAMSYSSALHLVRGVKSRLSHSGVEAEALFEQAGLNEGDGLACDALTLSDKLSHLWELVVANSGDPLI